MQGLHLLHWPLLRADVAWPRSVDLWGELPELVTAGQWESSRILARYTECQAAGRGAEARYYQGRRG